MPDNITRGHSSRRAKSSRIPRPLVLKVASPLEHRTAHPMAWEHAVAQVGGDTRRLTIEPDGSVVIHNGRVR